MLNKMAVVIFCAGYSSRMGMPKAFLETGDKTLVEHVIDTYRKAKIGKIVVVINNQFTSAAHDEILDRIRTDTQVIINEYPEKGRTYSVKLAAHQVSDYHACFFQNIDNPVPEVSVLEQLASAMNGENRYVVPSIKKQSGHPVLLCKNILQQLNEETGLNWKLNDVLKKFSKLIIEVEDERLLLNLNTPEDWNHYLNNYHPN